MYLRLNLAGCSNYLPEADSNSPSNTHPSQTCNKGKLTLTWDLAVLEIPESLGRSC